MSRPSLSPGEPCWQGLDSTAPRLGVHPSQFERSIPRSFLPRLVSSAGTDRCSSIRLGSPGKALDEGCVFVPPTFDAHLTSLLHLTGCRVHTDVLAQPRLVRSVVPVA